ncbi:hypothetical protein XENORESO_017829 [Xenotaenia resolanae]|uniref:Secreted protein n=1 Tax=Xenotaenia resolanae TaxID=208358 RepID=A0ABV0X9X9_9TELE
MLDQAVQSCFTLLLLLFSPPSSHEERTSHIQASGVINNQTYDATVGIDLDRSRQKTDESHIDRYVSLLR